MVEPSVQLARERAIPPGLVRALYDDAGWWPVRNETDIAEVISTSCAVGAWVGDELVGFARVVSDGRLRAFIEDVVVHEAYRRQGIATDMLRRIIDELALVDVVSLFCEPRLIPLYERLGFRRTSQVVLHRPSSRLLLATWQSTTRPDVDACSRGGGSS